MAYWWAFQGRAFEQQHEGGYLWAPSERDGRRYQFWTNVQRLRPDDVVFSYVHGAIVARSVVQSMPRQARRPTTFRTQIQGEPLGWQVDVQYELIPPLDIDPLRARLVLLMLRRHAPLDRNGRGNQGYLYQLPLSAAQLLQAEIDRRATNTQR